MKASLSEAPTVNIENVLVGEEYSSWVKKQQAASDQAIRVGDPGKSGMTIQTDGETVAARMTDHNSMYTQKYFLGDQGYLMRQSYDVGYRTAPGANEGMFVSLGSPTLEVVDRQGLQSLQQEFSMLANPDLQG